ncbi:hypothetical protein GCM10007886_33440 [Methylobacterium gregans]|nr:hypothetical protein GCM10007886_33440 [Methylobacterium gregans]
MTRQPPRPVRVACPRFPAPVREALRWDRGVRTYYDLQRAYAGRGGLRGQQESVTVAVEGEPGHLERREP